MKPMQKNNKMNHDNHKYFLYQAKLIINSPFSFWQIDSLDNGLLLLKLMFEEIRFYSILIENILY